MAPTAPQLVKEPYGCGWNDLRDAIRSSGGGRRRKHGIEVDPTLADEEQLDEDIVSSKKARTAPGDPGVFVTSRRGRRP
jgi:hypothetical protein